MRGAAEARQRVILPDTPAPERTRRSTPAPTTSRAVGDTVLVTGRTELDTAAGTPSGGQTVAPAIAVAADVAAVVAFVLIGRRSHAESDSVSGLFHTAWPFLVGVLIGWLVARGWRAPASIRTTGVFVWLACAAVGMLLRALSGQGVAVPSSSSPRSCSASSSSGGGWRRCSPSGGGTADSDLLLRAPLLIRWAVRAGMDGRASGLGVMMPSPLCSPRPRSLRPRSPRPSERSR